MTTVPPTWVEELPRARFWEAMDIVQWEGFWFEPGLVQPALTFKSTFEARDDDVFLASTMKTGTTWLKSLSLCIMQDGDDDVLTLDNPHFHVPTVESTVYSTKPLKVDIYDKSGPHLLHTHLPYALLPDSVKSSACKIVYIARNPKDTLVSTWHFFNSILRPFPLQDAVDSFCSGVHQYGSYFDHVAEYWSESRRRPGKVMFVTYEALKADSTAQVERIARFLGRPLGDGDADRVLARCRLERLKSLEVNRSGSVLLNVPNWSYFRRGEVGDWREYLTPEMERQIDLVSGAKLHPLGLFL